MTEAEVIINAIRKYTFDQGGLYTGISSGTVTLG